MTSMLHYQVKFVRGPVSPHGAPTRPDKPIIARRKDVQISNSVGFAHRHSKKISDIGIRSQTGGHLGKHFFITDQIFWKSIVGEHFPDF
nr:hypothetical protein [Actinopolyspora xinjiangensis]